MALAETGQELAVKPSQRVERPDDDDVCSLGDRQFCSREDVKVRRDREAPFRVWECLELLLGGPPEVR